MCGRVVKGERMMGFFSFIKGKKQGETDGKEARNKAAKKWWPDLSRFHKYILIKNITLEDVEELLEEYGELAFGEKNLYHFRYAAVPDGKDWIVVEYPDAVKQPQYRNFWGYHDIAIWLGQRAEMEFCVAVPKSGEMKDMFFSMLDSQNPYEDFRMGVYQNQRFYMVPSDETFEWKHSSLGVSDVEIYLQENYGFEMLWLFGGKKYGWKDFEVMIAAE